MCLPRAFPSKVRVKNTNIRYKKTIHAFVRPLMTSSEPREGLERPSCVVGEEGMADPSQTHNLSPPSVIFAFDSINIENLSILDAISENEVMVGVSSSPCSLSLAPQLIEHRIYIHVAPSH